MKCSMNCLECEFDDCINDNVASPKETIRDLDHYANMAKYDISDPKKKYYYTHYEECRKRSKKHRQDHLEEYKKRDRQYYKDHQEELNAYRRKYYQEHIEWERERKRLYRARKKAEKEEQEKCKSQLVITN